MSLSSTDVPYSPSSPAVAATSTRPELMDGIKDLPSFEKLYISVANRAINLYQLHGRRRFALKLHCKLAALENVQKRYESAQRLYSHLPSHYVGDRWTVIESSLLSKCSSLQKGLGMSREWLLSTLALVRSGVVLEEGRWSQEVLLETVCANEGHVMKDQAELAQMLMAVIREQALKLEKDFAAIGFPIFSITIANPLGSLSQNGAGSMVEAQITNLLPCTVEVDAVRMKFSGIRYDTLWFTTGSCKIVPGNTNVNLLCVTPADESLTLNISQIRISRIIFQYYHRKPTPGVRPKDADCSPFLEKVSFAKDPLGMDVKLGMPPDIAVEKPRVCRLSFYAGRNKLSRVAISLTSESPVRFSLKQSACNNGVPLITSDSAIEFTDVESHCQLEVMFPFTAPPERYTAEVGITVEFRVDAEPEVKRLFRKICALQFALPVRVSTQHVFRPDGIIFKVLLKTNSHNLLRIGETRMELNSSPTSDLTLRPERLKNQAPAALLHSQTSHHLFRWRPQALLESPGARPRLVIRYRLLVDEIVECLREKLSQTLQPHHTDLIPYLSERLKNFLESRQNEEVLYLPYLHRQKFPPDVITQAEWFEFVYDVEKDQRTLKELVGRLTSMVQDMPLLGQDCSTAWQKLIVPIDWPSTSVMITVTYEYSKGAEIRVGDFVAIHLKLSHSFRWCKSKERNDLINEPPEMIYELINYSENWLAGGVTRGTFFARDDSVTAIDLMMMPLRPGNLHLPEVTIQVCERTGRKSAVEKSSDASGEAPTVAIYHANLAQPIFVFPAARSSCYIVRDQLTSPVQNPSHSSSCSPVTPRGAQD